MKRNHGGWGLIWSLGVILVLWAGGERAQGQLSCGITAWVEIKDASTNLSRWWGYPEFTPLKSPPEFTNNTPREFYLNYKISHNGSYQSVAWDVNKTLSGWGWEYITDPFTGNIDYMTNGSFVDIKTMPMLSVTFYPADPFDYPFWFSDPAGYAPDFPNHWTVSNFVSTVTHRYYEYSESDANHTLTSNQDEEFSVPYTAGMLKSNFFAALSNATYAADWSAGTALAATDLTSSSPPNFVDTDISGNRLKYRFGFTSETNKSYIVVWDLVKQVQTATGYTNTTTLMVDTNLISGTGSNAYSAEYELAANPIGQQVSVGQVQVLDSSVACVIFSPNILYVCAGGSTAVGAVVFPPGRSNSVSFQVEDPDMAAVSGGLTNLVVTGLNTNGSTTIQALVGTNVVATALVNVVKLDVSSLTNVTVSPGYSAYFPVTLPSISGGFDFQSSDTNIALVTGDSSGFTATGVSNGTFSVQVRLNGTDLCQPMISGGVVSSTNVVISGPDYICVPNTVPITATIAPASMVTNITFDLADASATLSGTWPDLYVTAVSPGTNQVRAWAGTNLVGTKAFTAIQVGLGSGSNVSVGCSGMISGNVSIQPPVGLSLNFEIVDPTLASVSSIGTNFTVCGITNGTTSINVKLGATDLCLNIPVVVDPGLPGAMIVSGSALCVSGQIPFAVTFNPTNSAPASYTVVSANSGIVSVSGTNFVGAAAGTTVVRLMSGTNQLASKTMTTISVTFSTNDIKQAVGTNVMYGVTINPTNAGVTISSTDTERLKAVLKGTNLWVQILKELPKPAEIRAQLGTNQLCATLSVVSTNTCGCKCVASSSEFWLGSIDVSLGLGQGLDGHALGGLRIWEKEPSDLIGRPALLQYHHTWSEVDIRRSGSDLRQLKTPMVLADVVTISTNEFRVNFYNDNLISGGGGGSLYSTSGTPFSVFRFENMGGAARDWLRVTESRGGNDIQRDYRWSTNDSNWRIEQAGREEGLVTTFTTNGTIICRVETRIRKLTGGAEVSKSARTYQRFSWGEALVEETHSPDSNPLTTTFTYSDTGQRTGVDRGDGSWQRQEYNDDGWLARVFTGVDNQGPTTDPTLCRTVEYEYSPPVSAGDTGEINPGMPRCITERLFNQPVSKRYTLYRTNEVWDIRCLTPSSDWNATGNLVTITRTVDSGTFLGELDMVWNPDGTIRRHAYSSLGGGGRVVTVWAGAPDSTGTNVNAGLRTVTTNGPSGETISVHTYDVASTNLVNWLVYTNFDEFARPTMTLFMDGTRSSVSYGCCGVDSESGRDGSTTTYTYDVWQRVLLTIRNGLTYSNVYDAADNVIAVTRIGTDGSQILQRTAGYDQARRLVAETNAVGAVTTFDESFDSNGNRTRTVTYPDTGTRTETIGRGGSLYEVSGSAAFPLRRVTCLELVDGQTYPATKEIRLTSTGGITEWVKTCLDYLGRPFVVRYAGGGEERSYYNALGQLGRRVDADGVVTLYAYNEIGELETTAVDVNQNGTIDTSGPDRVTQIARSVTVGSGSTVVRRQENYVYRGSSPELVSTMDSSVDGLRTWNTRNGQTASSVTFITTNSHTWITNTAHDGSYTVTDRLMEQVQSVFSYSSVGQQLAGSTFSYDPHGRLTELVDARNGTNSYVYDDEDRVVTTITPVPVPGGSDAQTNTYVYDVMGRLVQTIRPYSRTNFTDYFVNGLVQRTYGALAYPVAYTYDGQGRMKTMTTWQDYVNQTGSAVTTWNYDANRGHLRQKLYANNVGPQYAYTAAGRPARRTWGRGVITAYGYNLAGDLETVDYSDTTPDVVYTYDRMGLPATVAHGTNSVSMTWSLSGRALLETNTAGVLAGLTVVRTEDSLGRLTSMIAAGATNYYGYDASSRLTALTNGSLVMSRSYVSNSALPADQALAMSGTLRLTHQFNYDHLNRLVAVSNLNASLADKYGYAYNQLNQRYQMTTPQGRTWEYAYDSLGQVVGAGALWAGTTNGVPGMLFGFSYDDIGNRKQAARDAVSGWRTASYTSDSLNQYVQRTVPGYVNVLGEVNTNVALTVNAQPTERYGTYYRAEVPVLNFIGPVWQDVTNLAVLLGAAPGGGDLGKTQVGHVFVAPTPEVYIHDADGNLLADGRYSYTWNGENRLVAVEALPEVPTGARRALELAYDHLGRRILKRSYAWNSGAYTLAAESHFLYDGWNLAATLSGSNTVLQRYAWGADLSGTFQGAGGVSGLLAVWHTNNGTYLPEYDGNGNVVGLVDAATGTKAAVYEYGPFGELLRMGGAMAANNPFRYSTKYQDDETGFLYYGHRYYDSGIGRWIGRDSIEEQGGLNIFNFVKNSAVNGVDKRGLDVFWTIGDDGLFKFSLFPPGWESDMRPALPGNPLNDEFSLLKFDLLNEPLVYDSFDYRFLKEMLRSTEMYPFGDLTLSEIEMAYSRGYISAFDFPVLMASDKNGLFVGLNGGDAVEQVLTTLALEAAFIGGCVKIGMVGRAYTSAENGWLNLASKQRTQHILFGDRTGGGHKFGLGRLFNGKTKFPMKWSSEEIMRAVSDIAADPTLTWVRQDGGKGWFYKSGKPARFAVEGIRNGVRIKVVLEPFGEGIITAHPK